MNCEQYRAEYISGVETEEGTRHVAGCVSCSEIRPKLRSLRAELAEPAVWEQPSAHMEDTLVSTIGTASVPRQRRRPRGRWWGAVAAVTVAAVAAVAVWPRGTSADWELPLVATPLAATANARARGWNTELGTRVEIDVRDLAAAPDGFVYELWFSRDHLHISGGTFAGSGKAELSVGVSRRDFPRVWITLEPIDEDEAPSGQTVLDSTG